MFSEFYSNSFRVVDQQWFNNLQFMEGPVLGRMVKSHEDGILSDGGLLGEYNVNITPNSFWTVNSYLKQKEYYFSRNPQGPFEVYASQIGAQGILFSFLDQVLEISPSQKLELFHALVSLLSAIFISAIFIWFYLEFGIIPAFFVLLSAIFSKWLIIFGQNIFWSLWAFYMPMIVLMYYLKYGRIDNRKNYCTKREILFSIIDSAIL
jgi:hypothetical protein